MEKDNLIIYVSSHNNYDMLEGEVLKNINREGFELINIDDKSCNEEVLKGKSICEKHNIVFLENKSRGVQMATQTLIDFINKHRPNCKYILCFQHDVVPLTSNFFSQISNLISNKSLEKFGAISFNVLDRGKYCRNFLNLYNQGNFPFGMMGIFHLSNLHPSRRWISPHHNDIAIRNPHLFSKPFSVDIPMWMCVGINVDIWNKCVTPTEEYHFHLWFPDISMQLNYNNYPIITLPHLYCLNQQEVKSKYNINPNSAKGAMKGNEYHFGEYSNFKSWKERWGWEYENVFNTFEPIKEKYKGTLIYEYFHHDVNKGPLNTYEL